MKLGATIKRSVSAAFFLLAAASLLFNSAPAQAQDPTPSAVQAPVLPASQEAVVIETMRVDIWPEYDKPSVLVIYHITLSAQTALPASLSIRLPAKVGEPHAVAMQDPNGLYNINYKTQPAGEWVEIQFSTPVPDVRIEYYDPGLTRDGNARSFTYTWPGDYAVNDLSFVVQQPASATNFALKPNMGSSSQGDDGLTYYSIVAGKVDAATTFDLSATYDKADDTLTSAQFQAVAPSQPVDETTAGRVNLSPVLPWVLGGAGLLLIAAGVFWYLRPGQAAQSVSRQRHASKASPLGEESRTDGAFCHQCGKKAAPGDAFCRACGTRLKS